MDEEAPVPQAFIQNAEAEEQMPNLDELRAICDLNTENVDIKVEPLEPEYLDNDVEDTAEEWKEDENEACPENIVIKAEPFIYNNDKNCGKKYGEECDSTTEYHEEQDADNIIKCQKRKIKKENDADYAPPVKKPIIKPKFKYVPPKNVKKRSERKKRPTSTNLHSYNAITNIEVVSISEEERLQELIERNEKIKNSAYKCPHCPVGFISTKAFDKHMESHTPREGYVECDLCHTYLKSEDMLYQHKLRHYRRYRCLLCVNGKAHRDRETVACHIRTEHEQDRFPCEYCGKTFKRPAYLKNHVEQHHTKPLTLACPHCDLVYHQKNWFRWHLRSHDSEVKSLPPLSTAYVCSLCSARFRKRIELVEHLGDKHAGLQYTLPDVKRKKKVQSLCEPCNRYFSSRELLNHHKRRMHRDRTKRFQCDYCKRFYFTKSEVRSHIEWSHLRWRDQHTCHCGRQFRAPALLTKHQRKVHGGEPPPPRDRPCPECGKSFTNEQAVRRHMKCHLGLKYPCPLQCGEQFCSPQYARTHYQLRHLNMTRAEIKKSIRENKIQKGLIPPDEEEPKRDKECPECGKTFFTMQAVKRHQKSHLGVKYPCPECDEKFCSTTYAKIHYQLRHLQMTRAEIRANTQANKKSYVNVNSMMIKTEPEDFELQEDEVFGKELSEKGDVSNDPLG